MEQDSPEIILKMHVIWLSREDELLREIKGFARALQRAGAHLTYLSQDSPAAIDIRSLIEKSAGPVSLIVHPEPWIASLPRGLTEVSIPTVGFQCDVYAYTHRRILYSMLFDYVAILHPGFEEIFQKAGHPSTVTLPFAIDPEDYFDSGEERVYDVASVGRLFPNLYKNRMEILSGLSREFRMNAWDRFVPHNKVAEVYRAGKIAINVPRDDYPTDVSLRFAEAMACGALFLTRTPTEMTALGFEENVHYIGYREAAEVADIVRRYLKDEDARLRIARAGHDKVMREHTYDVRIANLLARIRDDAGKLRAPARSWPPSKTRLAYLDYFSGNRIFGSATEELWSIVKAGAPESWKGVKLLGRSAASYGLGYLRSRRDAFFAKDAKP